MNKERLKAKLIEIGYAEGNEVNTTINQLGLLEGKYLSALEAWINDGTETAFSNDLFSTEKLTNYGFSYPNTLITFLFYNQDPDSAVEALKGMGVIE